MAQELARLVDRVRDTELIRRISHCMPRLNHGSDATEAPEPHIALEVIGGLHAGAKLDLTETIFTVGSSVDADIVLSDPEIADTHGRFRVVGGRGELEALGGAIGLANGQTVPEGYGRRCRLPLEVSIGGATIRLTDTSPAYPAKKIVSSRSMMIAAGLVATIFAVPVASNTLSQIKPEVSSGTAVEVAEAVGPDSAGQSDMLIEGQAKSALESHLAQAGINSLDVAAAPGRLVVSGSITDHQVGAWRAAQAWFDKEQRGRPVLISNVAVGNSTEAPRLPLRAIWYGEGPYIITADGARYHEGAFVSGGWIIKEIGKEQLLLAKGEAVVALKYQ
ncbi:SctD/MshK family protein [Chelativorans salis]|uniref:FHA domain-containing protein n=1 Tax=Chelativorans salis TaxID=2978478 RepID=A0ABT2LQL5_9HYPH|nr:EscD/YscD/HrpQ family type III secretion system periplasmic domain-containing protein [Chelativorans sp. EGI FJ00035]MCT7376845.1 hypothetical protein [Chelativorans sp. EGI FJ00035]